MEITLKAEPRSDTGKGAARQARQAGKIPAVIYGADVEAQALLVDAAELRKALQTEAGRNVLINLKLDSKTKFLTMLREVQRDPVRSNVLHVDFLNVARDVKLEATVRVQLTGEAKGVKEGGVIEHHLWELDIVALPTDVPPALEVDVSELGIGDHVRVSDVKVEDGVEILNPVDDIVASVVEPQMMELPEDIAAEEAAAAEAAEGEEGVPAEGEEAEAGEGGDAGAKKEEEST